MSIYTNQAQRVIDHILSDLKVSEADLNSLFGINREAIENRIQLTVLTTKVNGKKAADILIELWQRQHPDYKIEDTYSLRHTYNRQLFKFRVLDKELICLFDHPLGSDLQSFPHSKKVELTHEYLDSVCQQVIINYKEKLERIKRQE
jgi:hypothetical protein